MRVEKDKKGITLIALVITIIVMLIMVAVTISMAISGGLFVYAGRANKDTELAKQKEQKLANVRENLTTGELIEEFTKDPALNPDNGKEPQTGDIYDDGVYIYKYNYYVETNSYWTENPTQNGWGVKVKTNGQEAYGPILQSINGKPITNLRYTFENCRYITESPEIPKTVTDMEYTFSGCSKLEIAPQIPNGVVNMTYTFDMCTSLTVPSTIPSSVEIMLGTYRGTGIITPPIIKEGVTNMNWAFSNCEKLTTTPIIPKSVTEMNTTFWGCESLTTAMDIPNGVTDISNAFGLCNSLEHVPKIPESVTNMERTFYNCISLKGTIEINAVLTTTQSYSQTFNNCAKDSEHEITLTGTCAKMNELKNTGYSNGRYIQVEI